MTLKRERKYSGILNKIDYYLKQADDWSAVDDLDDLIMAASSTFYFKEISDRTISMFNVSGDITYGYLSLQINPADTDFDSGAAAVRDQKAGAPTYGTGGNIGDGPFFGNLTWLGDRDLKNAQAEHTKAGNKVNELTEQLFPDNSGDDKDTTEAAEGIIESLSSGDGDYLDYSKDDIFPRQGILLHDDKAGAIRIQRVDWKDPSQGYNVYRNNASTEGGIYSKVLPWGDDKQTKLNDQPIKYYKNAYKASKDSMIAGGMDKGKKPKVRLGLGAQISRQQRRNLIQKVEKKLESREKAIKQGVRTRTRQRWKDNAELFLIELPDNARNAAGEGIRKLGEKALEAGDRLKEYEDMFREQAGAKIREGIERAKPEVRKALKAVANEAVDQFFNAQDTWESAKQFAREKAPIIQGILQQAKVKGSPIWNAAVKKGGSITDKVMYAAGVGLVRAQAANDAVSTFVGRMKSKFQEGYRAEMESRHGAMPSGDLYKRSPQEYWEKRGELATKYGRANADFDKENGIADRITDPEIARKAHQAASDKMRIVQNEVDVGAAEIGTTLEAVQNHVQKIKSGVGTVLPPAAGWPTAYGGASKVRSLQRNLKLAGLKPYKQAYTGIPELLPTVDEAAPADEAPDEAAAPSPTGRVGDTGPITGPGETPPPPRPQITGPGETPPPGATPPAAAPTPPVTGPGETPPPAVAPPVPITGPGETPPPGNGPGPQISGKADGGGGAAAAIPSEFREYATSAPYGLTLHQGETRGENKVSSFYDKREAAKAKEAQVESGGGLAAPGQPGWDAGKQQAGFTSGSTPGPRGQFNMAGENEMAAPMDDYKQAAEEEEFKAKRSQSKSKIRTARANARMAKARADEAEAKASRSEAESGAKIAHMLEKLDRGIIELTAHANPKVSSVLSRLEKAIDPKHKVPAIKK